MAQNKLEFHIQRDSRLTFKVAGTEELYIGQPVVIKGDMQVGLAGAADSEAVIGIVYGGTVGNAGVSGLAGLPDYVKIGFSGARKESVTVIVSGSLVYLPVTGVAVGDGVAAGTAGAYKKADPTKPLSIIGKVVSVTTKAGAGTALVLIK